MELDDSTQKLIDELFKEDDVVQSSDNNCRDDSHDNSHDDSDNNLCAEMEAIIKFNNAVHNSFRNYVAESLLYLSKDNEKKSITYSPNISPTKIQDNEIVLEPKNKKTGGILTTIKNIIKKDKDMYVMPLPKKLTSQNHECSSDSKFIQKHKKLMAKKNQMKDYKKLINEDK